MLSNKGVDFANAIIERGDLEKRLGTFHTYGSVSYRFGPNVRNWPKEACHELALAEEKVFTTQNILNGSCQT